MLPTLIQKYNKIFNFLSSSKRETEFLQVVRGHIIWPNNIYSLQLYSSEKSHLTLKENKTLSEASEKKK